MQFIQVDDTFIAYNFQVDILCNYDQVFGVLNIVFRQLYLSHIKKILECRHI